MDAEQSVEQPAIRIRLTLRQAAAVIGSALLRLVAWVGIVGFVEVARLALLAIAIPATALVAGAVFVHPVPPDVRLATWLGESAAQICQVSGVCDLQRLQVVMATGLVLAIGLAIYLVSAFLAAIERAGESSDDTDALEAPTAALFVSHYMVLDEASRETLLDLVQRVPADVDLAELVTMLREKRDPLPVENWPTR